MLSRVVMIIGLIVLASSPLVRGQVRNGEVGGNLRAQISGQVRYAEGGQPAFDVMVSCDAVNGGRVGQQLTDRAGKFRFSDLSPAQYIITVRVPGYIEQSETVEVLTAPTGYADFRLRADPSSRPATPRVVITDANVPEAAKKEFELAVTLLDTGKKGDLAKSILHLEKAIVIYPKFVEAQLQLGTAYMDLQQWDRAEQTLKRTIEIDAKAANAYFALGNLYLSQKKYDQAEKALQEGLAVEKNSARAHLTLARVYWDKVAEVKDEAQWRSALEKSYNEVNQALALEINLAAAHLLKGNLLFKVRRYEQALKEFEEYLRLDPKGQAADQTRAYVERIKKALADQKKP